jgi:ribonucleoside-diphosphate reductase alpha chain
MREVEVETATPSDSVSSVGIPVVEQNMRNEEPSATQTPEQRDLFARAQRRKLPDERKSVTHKFSVGGHEGYIIVGMYEEGTPGEIFIKMAKEGSTLSGFMDGVAVSISIGLQYGVPLKILVDKLTNTRFEPSGFTENPSIRYASSILDYIARWLGGKFLSPEYLKPRVASNDQEPNQAAPGATSVTPKADNPAHRGNGSAKVGDAPSCPTCGMLMVPNGSCYKCVNCGSTRGCSY